MYTGGTFTTIGGQMRTGIAALDIITGNATSWNPSPSGGLVFTYASALAISGTTIYAGGSFNNIGGQARNNIAALDILTGNATSWNPNSAYPINELTALGTTIYAGGNFFGSIGGQTRHYIAALDASSGNATNWNPNAQDKVYTIVALGKTLYIGGGFFDICGKPQCNFAAMDDPYNPVLAVEKETEENIPRDFTLSQNYPNPFNPITTIEFTLAKDSKVSLKVFDILGREVATLINDNLKAGILHKKTIDASKLSSGMYFYRLQAREKSMVKKLVLLK